MWGTAYYVTKTFLPADYPLYGALIRAIPAGLILLDQTLRPRVRASRRVRSAAAGA